MKRISILNFKGGVGKTSISTNSAHKLAMMGYKVLLIDCDIQANASNLIPQKDRKPTTLTHVLKGEATFEDTIQKARENLYLIAADSNLDKAANHIVRDGTTPRGRERTRTRNSGACRSRRMEGSSPPAAMRMSSPFAKPRAAK